MKLRLKRIAGVVVTVCLIAVFVTVPGHLLRPTDCDMCIDAIDAFHDLPEDSVDVIGFGSSHMWRSLNTVELYENFGMEAYNYGCNWQHLNTTLLFMQDAFRTQSPKVVLVECFHVNELLYNVNMDGEIFYTTAIKGVPEKEAYLEQCFCGDIERYLSYYVPIVGFHDNWANIGGNSFKVSSNTYDFRQNRGFVETEGEVPIYLNDFNLFTQKPLAGSSIAVLDQMVELCEENDAQIIFFVTPYQGEWAYHDAMEAYAKEHGYAFFDFFELADEIGLDTNTDFQDGSHTNTKGANKITNYLGKYIEEQLLLVEKSE